MTQEVASRSAMGARLRRIMPLVAIVTLMAIAFAFDLHHYLSLSSLAEHREALQAFVARNPVVAPIVFMMAYAIAVALSIPGAIFLTLAGGFMFGTWIGTIYVVVGATAGAVVIFLVARTALGKALAAKAGPWMARLEAGFREDAFSYLLVLRLVPLFPFWLVNLVPALLGVGLGTYALATLIGIIPGAFVYASVGNGLGALLDAGGTPDLGIITSVDVLLPLLGLAVLALVPVAYKRMKKQGTSTKTVGTEAGDA